MTVLNSESFEHAAYALMHAIQDFRGIDPEPFRQIVASFGDHVDRLAEAIEKLSPSDSRLSLAHDDSARKIVKQLNVEQLRERLEELDVEAFAIKLLLRAARAKKG